MYLQVKAWARKHHINDPRNGTLNSYALTLLVLYHLQMVEPPVMPRMSRLLDTRRPIQGGALHESGGEAVPLAAVRKRCEELGAAGYGLGNAQSAAELFLSLLVRFMALAQAWQAGAAADVRLSAFGGALEQGMFERDYFMLIEDPFDSTDNAARTVGSWAGAGNGGLELIVQSLRNSVGRVMRLDSEAAVGAMVQELFGSAAAQQLDFSSLKATGVSAGPAVAPPPGDLASGFGAHDPAATARTAAAPAAAAAAAAAPLPRQRAGLSNGASAAAAGAHVQSKVRARAAAETAALSAESFKAAAKAHDLNFDVMKALRDQQMYDSMFGGAAMSPEKRKHKKRRRQKEAHKEKERLKTNRSSVAGALAARAASDEDAESAPQVSRGVQKAMQNLKREVSSLAERQAQAAEAPADDAGAVDADVEPQPRVEAQPVHEDVQQVEPRASNGRAQPAQHSQRAGQSKPAALGANGSRAAQLPPSANGSSTAHAAARGNGSAAAQLEPARSVRVHCSAPHTQPCAPCLSCQLAGQRPTWRMSRATHLQKHQAPAAACAQVHPVFDGRTRSRHRCCRAAALAHSPMPLQHIAAEHSRGWQRRSSGLARLAGGHRRCRFGR